jgi:hypothetical protein
MHALNVVIVLELCQLPDKVDRIPEEQVIEIFATDGANKPSMNGCEVGTYGIDLTSSIARTRRFASQP